LFFFIIAFNYFLGYMYFGGKVSVFSGYIYKRAVVKSEFVAEISFLY